MHRVSVEERHTQNFLKCSVITTRQTIKKVSVKFFGANSMFITNVVFDKVAGVRKEVVLCSLVGVE